VERTFLLIKILCLETPCPTIEIPYQDDILMYCISRDIGEEVQEWRLTLSMDGIT